MSPSLETPPADPANDSNTRTLPELLATQQHLERAAALALPHSFAACTYALGALRQPVYWCRTCAVPRGICAACSVACHTDHEQLELFPKRAFRCDCPTRALAHPCCLHTNAGVKEDMNTANAYGRNFRGEFCRCDRPYDAMEEVETMIQCLACEVRAFVFVFKARINLNGALGLVPRVVPQPSRAPRPRRTRV
jgi:E3 ubiquitin-protein ligase UBR7